MLAMLELRLFHYNIVATHATMPPFTTMPPDYPPPRHIRRDARHDSAQYAAREYACAPDMRASARTRAARQEFKRSVRGAALSLPRHALRC